MDYQEIKYVGSFPRVSKAPKNWLPEYAFIGRSNVGKSSLINALLGRKDLARVSSTPGKTQMLNFYEVEGKWTICDLPGYGYAKLSKKHRTSMQKMVNQYLLNREQLQCAFVLVDSNIPPQKIDLDFINWLGENQVPFVVIFTKADRVKPARLEENIDAIKQALLEYWEELPPFFVSSSNDGRGREEILKFITEVNRSFHQ
jgi:GTP-binding protein